MLTRPLSRPEPPPWLKGPPAPQPPAPQKNDLQALHLQAVELESRNVPSGPAMAYIKAHGPTLQVDKWGGSLPLSGPDQDRLDRMVAILSLPMQRGLQLIFSGTLDPGETDAIRTVYPDIYRELVHRALQDMATTPPPYSIWAEQTLGVLFGRPAARVYNDQVAASPPGMPHPRAPKADSPDNPTPADRREIAVRQER